MERLSQRSKISSLRELREQKDVLMAQVYASPAGVRTQLLEANGMLLHVTLSDQVSSINPDELLLLVHGGLFMSGSPEVRSFSRLSCSRAQLKDQRSRTRVPL